MRFCFGSNLFFIGAQCNYWEKPWRS